jgi:chromosome segregation ATPase
LATKVVTLPEIEEARRNLPPIPPVPDGGPFDWARYAVTLEWARWQRRKIMRTLSVDTGKDTTGLDGVFGELGRTARAARIEGRVFADENQGLDEAERRRVFAEQACADLTGKRADENAKYEGIQHDLAARATERESELRAATSELERLDGQRRALRDKKRDLDKKQKAIYKSADEREEQASRSQMGDSRQALRQAAAELRREAGRLDADLQDVDGRLGGLERPIADAQALVEKTRSDYSSAKRDLDNAREGHRHRVAELEAEQARRSRELLQAEAEINRRLVTLGTIVNLNRIGRPEFQPLYERADDLRGAISAREAEVDRLEAEREAFDNPSRVRGFVVLAIATLALVTLIWVIVAMAL